MSRSERDELSEVRRSDRRWVMDAGEVVDREKN